MDVKCYFKDSLHGEMRSPCGISPIVLQPGLLIACSLVGMEIEVKVGNTTLLGEPHTGFYKLQLFSNESCTANVEIPFGFEDAEEVKSTILGIESSFVDFMEYANTQLNMEMRNVNNR